ncbi:peroxidase-like isoform X3 [Sipha flava]|uniref:Peroxidase-like isoform X3 n=1 Tax=Sipha flava TaxID=143950 RepID=A0A8B8FBY5_9HEMI|nr:peroxidase-like isoform X3 [Sipha flava]
MVNDLILLETFGKDEETTFLLPRRNDLKNDNGRIFYGKHRFKMLIIFLTFAILVSTFVISVISFWTVNSSDDDSPIQSTYSIDKFGNHSTLLKNDNYIKQCATIVSCDFNDKYRTINGTCNNLNNPTWGSSNTPFIRLVGAHYSDDCCSYQNQLSVSKACEAIIKIPMDDPVYSKYNKTCMEFTRAMTSINYSCSLQSSEPSTFMNDATHYIDGSQIYGSDDHTASTLRSYTNGKMKSVTREDDFQESCPYSFVGSSSSFNKTYSSNSGANSNLGMALFHDMFLRFHNFVALELKNAVPLWSDETLYQESRKIVGAVIQHITYTQFLPTILGKKYTEERVLAEDDDYIATVNPSTSQEFSAGAFRVLHSIVPAQHRFVDSKYITLRTINVTDWTDCPYLLRQGSNFDDLLRGLLFTEGRLRQPSYNPLISNLMFHSNNLIGVDLLSYDIQRGRDTGLPPYNKIRELCGLPVAKSFTDLIDVMPLDDIYDLEKLYSSVDDVDFLVGALLETPETDALVGNTSRCIIGDFFYRSRVGDRFFYDGKNLPKQFSSDQLEIIKSISLNHIICATSSVDNLQKHIFAKVDNGWYSSMKWTCNEKYIIDFKPWEKLFINLH